jgi:hypothetical protein
MAYPCEQRTPRSPIPSRVETTHLTTSCPIPASGGIFARQAQSPLIQLQSLDSLSESPSLSFAVDESDTATLNDIWPYPLLPSFSTLESTLESVRESSPYNHDLPSRQMQDNDLSLSSGDNLAWISGSASAPSEIWNTFCRLPSRSRTQSPLIASTASKATLEDLVAHLSIYRRCIELGHDEAGQQISENLIRIILAEAPEDRLEHVFELVFHGERLNLETAAARCEAVISQQQQRHDFDCNENFQILIGLITLFLGLLDEIMAERLDWEREVENRQLKNGLKSAGNVLEKILRTSFPVEVVREFMPRLDVEEDGLEEEEPQQSDARQKIHLANITEAYITVCAKRPVLMRAVLLTSEYGDVWKAYKVGEALRGLMQLGFVVQSKESKRITLTARGQLYYSKIQEENDKAENDGAEAG